MNYVETTAFLSSRDKCGLIFGRAPNGKLVVAKNQEDPDGTNFMLPLGIAAILKLYREISSDHPALILATFALAIADLTDHLKPGEILDEVDPPLLSDAWADCKIVRNEDGSAAVTLENLFAAFVFLESGFSEFLIGIDTSSAVTVDWGGPWRLKAGDWQRLASEGEKPLGEPDLQRLCDILTELRISPVTPEALRRAVGLWLFDERFIRTAMTIGGENWVH